MIMIFPRWWLFGLLPALLAGCASLIFPTGKAPVYYQLDYRSPTMRCSRAFPQGVRVWKFATSSPYDRTEMVVLQPDGQVRFSGGFQWVAKPGTLVAESLQRDLTCSSLFPQVVSPDNPTVVPLELTGHVFVYAWERGGLASWAVLSVEVSLINSRTPRKVIFRREYSLKSGPFVEDTSAAFARAMSALVREFSERFQRDLCATRTTSH
jgi:ABC-type uncharacterized transport system auxiliary subunit